MKKKDTHEVQNNILDYVSMVDIKLLKEERFSTIEILKAGTVHDRGLKITKGMMDDFVNNFHDGVFGTDLQVNFSHDRGGEAAGWVQSVFVENGILFAEVEWTPVGKEKIKSKQFRFISSELAMNYPHFSTGEKIKNVLIGIALTNTPAVKGLAPVQLSEQVTIYLNNQEAMKDKTIKLEEEEVKVEEEVKEEEVAVEEEAKETSEEEAVEEAKEEEVKEEAKEEVKEEEVEEEVKEELKEKADTIELSEYQKLEEKVNSLQEKLEMKELAEEVEDTMTLSLNNSTGFADANVGEVVDFMIGLSEEQRSTFKELIGKVKQVDLSTIGSTSSVKAGLNTDNVIELADKLLEEGKAANIETAQKMAVIQLAKQ